MNRGSARRYVSAGAILALAIWVGGLPAAAAEGPVPDAPTATASAAPAVGDGFVTGATPAPTPPPSVEPSAPPTNTAPDPSPQPTATAPANDPPGQEPPAGPGPTPTADPTTPDVRPTSGTGPLTNEPNRGQVPDTAGAATAIVIGDFDCQSLTTTVTLDNSAASAGASFAIHVGSWAAGVYQPYSSQDVAVGPGQVHRVTVDLVPDAFSEVSGSGGGAYVTKKGMCGSYAMDPRATIDDMDCSALQANITLDNTRSTDVVLFSVDRVSIGEIDWEDAHYHQDVAVSARQQVTVHIPLSDPALNRVSVTSGQPLGQTLATSDDTICGALAEASIAPLDCESLSTVVTLDNSRLQKPTTFAVHAGDLDNYWNDLTWKIDWTIEVAPGTVRNVSVPLSDDAPNVVEVKAPGVRADRKGVCGTWVMEPRATIGEFDCDSLEVPVTLDNSGSSSSAAFNVFTMDSNMDFSHQDTYVLAAGKTRVLRVKITHDAATDVWVRPGYPSSPEPEIARARGPACGLVSVGPVDCKSMTTSVTLKGFAPQHGGLDAAYLISSTKHPTVTTAYARKVTVGHRATKVVRVPVLSLAGGYLRVQEVGATQVTYEEPVVAHCPAGSGGPGSATTSGVEMLAATGSGGLPQLVLAGLLLLTVGGLLIRVGRERGA